MGTERHKRISELFLEACELEGAARAEFLDSRCAGDLELRAEIEALLEHDSETAPRVGLERVTPDERIGPYRLLQKLGDGGMGEVWLAEQTEPLERRVALKVIKQGMDTKQVIARFKAERQALALMDHPNVAKVFDAGATPSGRPYFVMEHVHGVPITEHCDRHRLTTRERLELFRRVCEGVQHAHQKAIMHRDLKPSNVLVALQDGRAVPKIIDFGVAKATAQRLTERTVFTELGVLIGTPEYMSPEQAEMTGQDVDTRTDVYSLGVLLYELLTGTLPFDPKELRRAGLDEIRRRIREEEPPKPSARVSTLGGERSRESAARRRVDLPTLRSQLRGDLDWIVMHGLEKDRTRRYGSPQELAADIERYLTDQPVLAGPPSAAYRTRKFVRRNRFGLGVAAAGVLLLAGFAVTMAVQASRIAAERDRANRERETSDRVSEFLGGMLADVDPQGLGIALWEDVRKRVAEVRRDRGAADDEVEAAVAALDHALSGVSATDTALQLLDKQILVRAAETIERDLIQEPRIAGRLEHTLGSTYRKLGLYEPAERHDLRAVEACRQVLGRDHPDTLRSEYGLATTYNQEGRYDEAKKLFREVVETQRRVLGEGHPDTLRSVAGLAWAYHSEGRYGDAEKLLREALETQRRVLGPDHPETLQSMAKLGNSYYKRGLYDQAEELFRETLEIRRSVLGPENPWTLWSMSNLADAYAGQGRFGEAEELHRETFEIRRRALGREHPSTLASMHSLAYSQLKQGLYSEAEKLSRETLEVRRRVLRQDHPDTLASMIQLGVACYHLHRYDEAQKLQRETLEISRRVLGPEHPETLNSMIGLAAAYYGQGRYDEAEKVSRETLEISRRVLGRDHPTTLDCMNNVAYMVGMRGRHDEAETLHREVLEIRDRLLGHEHPQTLSSKRNLAGALSSQGRYEEAEKLFRENLEARRTVLGQVVSLNDLALLLLTREPTESRDPQEATVLALEAADLSGYEDPWVLDTLALAYHVAGDSGTAAETQQKAIALLPEGQSTLRAELEKRLAEYEAALKKKGTDPIPRED